MSDFSAKLIALTSKEAADTHGSSERFGAMIENLSRALGFTIAMASGGNGKIIDNMIFGAEGYAHSEAVSKAPIAKFMNELRGKESR